MVVCFLTSFQNILTCGVQPLDIRPAIRLQ